MMGSTKGSNSPTCRTYRRSRWRFIRSNSLGSRTYNYQYDATSKRLSQLTLPNASIARNISFDAQGNMSSNGSQSYAFDKANRLQSVNGIEAYQYDGHGRRVKITRLSDNKISYPIYSLDGKLVTEDDARSNKTIDYIYLNGSLLAKRSATIGSNTYTASYLHTDVLGSPISESNAAKVVTRIERFTPYGEPSDQTYDQSPGFTGHTTDAATGLTYAQQRYYDPICGCFISPDPVQTDPNTGTSFNRYNYANNNPFRFTDPDGRQFSCAPNCSKEQMDAEWEAWKQEDARNFMSVVMIGPTAATGGYYIKALSTAAATYYSKNSKQVNEAAYRVFCGISMTCGKGDDGYPDMKKDLPDQRITDRVAQDSTRSPNTPSSPSANSGGAGKPPAGLPSNVRISTNNKTGKVTVTVTETGTRIPKKIVEIKPLKP